MKYFIIHEPWWEYVPFQVYSQASEHVGKTFLQGFKTLADARANVQARMKGEEVIEEFTVDEPSA